MRPAFNFVLPLIYGVHIKDKYAHLSIKSWNMAFARGEDVLRIPFEDSWGKAGEVVLSIIGVVMSYRK